MEITKEEWESLNNQLVCLSLEADGLSAQLATERTARERAEADIQDAKEYWTALRAQTELMGQNAALRARVAELEAMWRRDVDEIERERDTLRTELTEARETIKRLNYRTQELEHAEAVTAHSLAAAIGPIKEKAERLACEAGRTRRILKKSTRAIHDRYFELFKKLPRPEFTESGNLIVDGPAQRVEAALRLIEKLSTEAAELRAEVQRLQDTSTSWVSLIDVSAHCEKCHDKIVTHKVLDRYEREVGRYCAECADTVAKAVVEEERKKREDRARAYEVMDELVKARESNNAR